jgi:hypothetical protein
MANTAARRALSTGISAIQVVLSETGAKQIGLITQITPDGDIQVCGPGFDDRTVQVTLGGLPYFVFREDLELRFGPLQS